MGARTIHQILIPFFFLSASGCLEPYEFQDKEAGINLMVVDSFLDVGNPDSYVRLSRTRELSSEVGTSFVAGARLTLEGENGEMFELQEKSPGQYYLANQPLITNNSYRLKIIAPSRKEYLSDFIKIKPTPEIDSVYWKPNFSDEEVGYFLATHDATDRTRKYRWRFSETWEYTARFYSALKLINGIVYKRDEDKSIYTCWHTDKHTDILLGATDKLNEDIIVDYPLISISRRSDKLKIRHSLFVEQFALSDKEYEYWRALEKNTENLGTLFDPLPSQITGNLRCITDPNETILGYFNIYDIKETRIFLEDEDVEDVFGIIPTPLIDPSGCSYDKILLEDIGSGFGKTFNADLIAEWYADGIPNPYLAGYYISSKECLDCRLKGGVNKKPGFW